MFPTSKSIKMIFFIGASLIALVARLPASVSGLEAGEEVVDDFDTGTTFFWQLDQLPYTTAWYLTKQGDPAPFGLDARRPPSEGNDNYFLEVVPLSVSVASTYSRELELLPGATAELEYWNAVPFPIETRNTALLLSVEYTDTQKTYMVFTAPKPVQPNPNWITVKIDLNITEPSKVQVRSFQA